VYNGDAVIYTVIGFYNNSSGDKHMAAKHEHTLSNGFTYLAVTAGHYGSWAKATDPLTAIQNAANENGYGEKNKVLVMCVYGKNGSVYCGNGGGIVWENDETPTPIGLFTVNPRGITPTKKGDLNDKHESCVEWIETVLQDIKRSQATIEEEVA